MIECFLVGIDGWGAMDGGGPQMALASTEAAETRQRCRDVALQLNATGFNQFQSLQLF